MWLGAVIDFGKLYSALMVHGLHMEVCTNFGVRDGWFVFLSSLHGTWGHTDKDVAVAINAVLQRWYDKTKPVDIAEFERAGVQLVGR